jgi:hypothetical protein
MTRIGSVTGRPATRIKFRGNVQDPHFSTYFMKDISRDDINDHAFIDILWKMRPLARGFSNIIADARNFETLTGCQFKFTEIAKNKICLSGGEFTNKIFFRFNKGTLSIGSGEMKMNFQTYGKSTINWPDNGRPYTFYGSSPLMAIRMSMSKNTSKPLFSLEADQLHFLLGARPFDSRDRRSLPYSKNISIQYLDELNEVDRVKWCSLLNANSHKFPD